MDELKVTSSDSSEGKGPSSRKQKRDADRERWFMEKMEQYMGSWGDTGNSTAKATSSNDVTGGRNPFLLHPREMSEEEHKEHHRAVWDHINGGGPKPGSAQRLEEWKERQQDNVINDY